MAEQAILDREVIDTNLVGKGIEYRVLKEPKELAYPNGDEVRYHDLYLTRLNQLFSIDDVLGSKKDDIKKRKFDSAMGILVNSPLQNMEGEGVLARILINSSMADLWQPFTINVPRLTDTSTSTAKEYLERVDQMDSSYNIGKINAGILFGLYMAKKGGFVLPIGYDNKVIVVPTQKFVEYCAKKK